MMHRFVRGSAGNIFAMLFGAVAMTGLVGAVGMQTVMGPITTASKVTHQNMADTDLMTNARVVVMNAATLTDGGDIDADGYVEPAPYLPTGSTGCAITLPGAGGCLPADIGASLTDPWGTQYAYCVWDHGDPASSVNRISGGDSTSEAVIALISAGPDKTFQTPCLAYDPGTPDQALIDPDGLGDDKVRTYTYDAAVAGAHGLWSLKPATPDTAVISKKLEVGDVTGGTGFTFDTTTGIGEFPSVKTDYLASMSGGSTPVTMASNIALDGSWLSGDGGDEGITVLNDGKVKIVAAQTSPALSIVQTGDAGEPNYRNYLAAYDSNDEMIWYIGDASNQQRVLVTARGPEDSYYPLDFEVGMAPRMRITPEGNIGIGTLTPSHPLTVSVDGSAGGHSAAIKLVKNFSGQTNGGPGIRFDNLDYVLGGVYASAEPTPGGGLRFYVSDDGVALKESMSILSNGNVGIGTTEAGERLHVRNTQGGIRIQDSDGSNPTTANPYLSFTDESGARIGYVGDGSVYHDELSISADTGRIRLFTGSSADALVVSHTGQIGLGTTDPQRHLHVTGHIRTDAGIYLGSAEQYLRGDNSSALYWQGVHSTVTQMLFQDNEGTTYGRVYGSGDGLYFGLLDGDGHWSYLHSKDTYTSFQIDNTTEMTLYPTYLHLRNNQIKYLADPTAAQDAATKSYVDSMGGLNCATGQIVKWSGSDWECAGDSIGTDSDNLGNHTATQNIRLGSYWLNGDAGNEGLSVSTSGQVRIDQAGPNTAYDVWIQGGDATSGEARNLALLGVNGDDTLRVNHSSEYTGGTIIGGPVQIAGSLDMNNNAIISSAGTIRDGNGGWVRTYGNTGWYSATHGGGWYMTDSSYLRNYNAKGVYVNTNGLPALWGVSGSSYGVHGTSDSTYGVYGYTAGATYGIRGGTASASHGGVIGYSANTNIYGILGHANAYSLYGNGQIYVLGNIRTAGRLYSQDSTGYGYIGVDGDNHFRFDDSTLGGEVYLKLAGDWRYHFDTGNFRPYVTNAISLGDSSTRWKNGYFAGNIYAAAYYHNSDRRLKRDIADIDDPFAILSGIDGKHYTWKKSGQAAYGVIAQDVEAVMPEAVITGPDGIKSVEYDQLIAPLIEAVKQLKADNDDLRDQIRVLTEGAH